MGIKHLFTLAVMIDSLPNVSASEAETVNVKHLMRLNLATLIASNTFRLRHLKKAGSYIYCFKYILSQTSKKGRQLQIPFASDI